MPHDVDITTGGDNSALASSFAEMRGYAEKAREDISHEFAKAVAFTGIVAGIEGVIEKVHELHHQSERFGIDAEQLQLIGNAAAQIGIPIEGVARGLNKMLIGGEEALQSQTALRVDMEKFHAADPAGKFLLIADAVKEAGLSTESYDAVAKIFGSRFGTELIPLLIQGGSAIEGIGKSAGLMSDDTIESLDRTYKAWELYKNRITVGTAPAISFVLKSIASAVVTMAATLQAGATSSVAAFEAIRLAAVGRLGAAREALANYSTDFVKIFEEWKKNMAEITGNTAGGPKFQTPLIDPDAMPGGAGSSGGAGGSGGRGGSSSSTGSVLDQLAAKQRQYDLDHMTAQEKLNSLAQTRTEIETALAVAQQSGVLSAEDEAAFRIKLLENDTEREKVQADTASAAEKYTEEIQKAREAAEAEATAQERSNQILQLELNGHGDLVDSLQKGWEYEDKIADLTDRINQAWSEGRQTVAEQLTDLRDMVKEEERLTAEQDKQKKDRADAIRFNNERRGQQDAVAASTGGLTSATITDPRLQALIASGYQLSEWAITMATNPKTGTISDDDLIRRVIEYNNLTNFGAKNLSAGDANRALGLQKAQNAGAELFDAQQAASAALARSQLNTQINALLGSGGLTAVFDLPIFQQMLARLASIDSRLSPSLPGSKS